MPAMAQLMKNEIRNSGCSGTIKPPILNICKGFINSRVQFAFWTGRVTDSRVEEGLRALTEV